MNSSYFLINIKLNVYIWKSYVQGFKIWISNLHIVRVTMRNKENKVPHLKTISSCGNGTIVWGGQNATITAGVSMTKVSKATWYTKAIKRIPKNNMHGRFHCLPQANLKWHFRQIHVYTNAQFRHILWVRFVGRVLATHWKTKSWCSTFLKITIWTLLFTYFQPLTNFRPINYTYKRCKAKVRCLTRELTFHETPMSLCIYYFLAEYFWLMSFCPCSTYSTYQ